MKKKWKNEKNCEKPIREMSFWQLVFGKGLSGFVLFGKKFTREMSIRGNAVGFTTVNPMTISKNWTKVFMFLAFLSYLPATKSV